MGIKVGEFQEVCYQSVTLFDVTKEDLAAINDFFHAKDLPYAIDYTLMDYQFDDLLTLFQSDAEEFSEEFKSTIKPLLILNNLDEIYLLQENWS